MEAKGRGLLLTFIGCALLFAGLVCAFLGPVEMYVFYMFGPGGQFHYDGFGFGSFMFGNVASQIAGYYVIAAICLPLGYGHLVRRRWARVLAEASLWVWLVLGVPLSLIFLLILFSSKELSILTGLMAAAVVLLAYPLVPVLLLRFYRSLPVIHVFGQRDPDAGWLERRPMRVLVSGFLLVFFWLASHVPILFNGLFPVFGLWLSGLEGIVVTTVSILILALLTWGVFGQRLWAWWGAVVYFGLLTASLVSTLVNSTYLGLLAEMSLPAYEIGFLDGVPAQGWHFAAFFGLPLLLTLVLLVLSRPDFGQPPPVPSTDPQTTDPATEA